MAEQEVIKHTKKLFSIWKDSHGFWHKLREFVLEIFIIVFAISLSIYLHDRSEKKHVQLETKEFLLGLKDDLMTDTAEMAQDKISFIQSSKAFRYIVSMRLNQHLDKDSINPYQNYIFNTTGLIPNSGRFEGFKSAGKIGTIENKELQNNIMDLYQEDIPSLLASTNLYTYKKQKLFEYIAYNQKRLTDSTTNLMEVLESETSRNICMSLTYVGEILQRYDHCIQKMVAIINAINKEYSE